MLFQCLYGFKLVFYSTHSDDEPFLSAITALYLFFFEKRIVLAYIMILLEYIFCILLSILGEKQIIKSSKNDLTNYIEYCSAIYNFLKSCQITKQEEINEYKNRIALQIQIQKEEILSRQKNIEKWTQTFIIPIVLIILTSIMNNENNLMYNINNILFIIVSFSIIYFIIWGIQKLIYLLSERSQLNKKQNFVDDLQGVLDTQFNQSKFITKIK